MNKKFSYIINFVIGIVLGLFSNLIYFFLPGGFCKLLGGDQAEIIVTTINGGSVGGEYICGPPNINVYLWVIVVTIAWMFIAHKFIINKKSKKKIKKKK